MVDRHYSLNLKPWSARTLYVYAHADLAQKYSVGLQEISVPRLCSQEENYFLLPWSQGYRGLIPPRVPLLQYTSRKPLYNVYTVCEVLLSLTDRFRSRMQTSILKDYVKMVCCAHVWICQAILMPFSRLRSTSSI
jgi:hypothetical protein